MTAANEVPTQVQEAKHKVLLLETARMPRRQVLRTSTPSSFGRQRLTCGTAPQRPAPVTGRRRRPPIDPRGVV
jgi:hypothetical protein